MQTSKEVSAARHTKISKIIMIKGASIFLVNKQLSVQLTYHIALVLGLRQLLAQKLQKLPRSTDLRACLCPQPSFNDRKKSINRVVRMVGRETCPHNLVEHTSMH
eukprot:6185644-Pleurochrysis_carterae.AAC.1